MVRRFRPMLGRKPRRDHPNHHDVLFTDVRDDKCLLLRRRVSGDAGLPTDVEVFSLVLGVVGLSLCLGLMFAISWLYSLVALAFGFGVGFYVRSRRVSTDWGDAGAGFRFPSRSRSVTSFNREVNVSPRQELAAPNLVLCGLTRRLQ